MRISAVFLTFLLLIVGFAPHARAGLTMLTVEEPPTNYLHQDTIVGIIVDVVRKTQEEIGDATPILIWPPARVIDAIRNEPDVLAFTLGRTDDRIRRGFTFLGPVATRKHVLWRKEDSPVSVSAPSDILARQYRIGGIHGDWRTRLFEDEQIPVTKAQSHAVNLVRLVNGRIDLWISSDLETIAIAGETDIRMDSLDIAYIICEAPSFIVFSKGTKHATIKRWTEAFEGLKQTDFFERTAKKWSSILGVKLSFDPDRGFIISSE